MAALDPHRAQPPLRRPSHQDMSQSSERPRRPLGGRDPSRHRMERRQVSAIDPYRRRERTVSPGARDLAALVERMQVGQPVVRSQFASRRQRRGGSISATLAGALNLVASPRRGAFQRFSRARASFPNSGSSCSDVSTSSPRLPPTRLIGRRKWMRVLLRLLSSSRAISWSR